jgi:hypothetical protein
MSSEVIKKDFVIIGAFNIYFWSYYEGQPVHGKLVVLGAGNIVLWRL